MQLSVAICTHNAKSSYLTKTIEALKQQTLDQSQWKLLVVDNASKQPVESELVSWHAHAGVIREEQLGLTHARLRAIRELTGDIIVFVDDDNVLKQDYLEVVQQIAAEHPHIGAWSGQCHPEYDTAPEPWVRKYQGMLVIREFTQDVWSNLGHLAETMPCGAGLCVRRVVAQAYLALHESGKRPMLLDRQGTSLMSAGDNDLSACACDLGLGVGLFHRLELTHLISGGRTTEEYLTRLAEGIYYSAIYLQAFRGKQPPAKSTPKKLLEFLQGWRMPARDRRIFAACCRGENRALSELAQKPFPSGQASE